MLPKLTLDSFASYRTSQDNWYNIPIEFLELFKKNVPSNIYKYSFKGSDPLGYNSYLKLYARVFSVSKRYSELDYRAWKRAMKESRDDVVKKQLDIQFE